MVIYPHQHTYTYWLVRYHIISCCPCLVTVFGSLGTVRNIIISIGVMMSGWGWAGVGILVILILAMSVIV
jgi:hypothetical protein